MRLANLPSFALAPAGLDKLRLIHGSCRKPHGESLDALQALDTMISSTVADPDGRPHQLFLTGDQIYADDVAASLLTMLIDAGETLLQSRELTFLYDAGDRFKRGYGFVPKGIADVPLFVKHVLPGHRSKTIREACGFTVSPPGADERVDRNQLLSFKEYAAMYLFAWSPVLWPAGFPEFEEVFPGVPRYVVLEERLFGQGIESTKPTVPYGQFETDNGRLQTYRSTLGQVRRALANIPCYMMFDDHEITDDWNINRHWCDRVLAKPLGRRAVQNGLAAFAVFQAWGNDPAQFDSGRPGAGLLRALGEWIAEPDTQDSTARRRINELVNVPDDALGRLRSHSPNEWTHASGTLNWHFRVTGPKHQVLVLDTRTWRCYPGAAENFPVLMSDTALARQISDMASQGFDVTLVISPVPVFGIPYVEAAQEASVGLFGYFAKDPEAWFLQPAGQQAFLSTLAKTLAENGGGPEKKASLVFLSGDVHYGYSIRSQYFAKRRFEKNKSFEGAPEEPLQMVAVQLTASALKNEIKDTRGLHTSGFSEVGNYLENSIQYGWNNADGPRPPIGVGSGSQSFAYFLSSHPQMLNSVDQPFLDLEPIPPHWWYRLDNIVADNLATEKITLVCIQPESIVVPPPSNLGVRKAVLKAYMACSVNHSDYAGRWGHGKEIVGLNNLGEISFIWTASERAVVQNLWWSLMKKQGNQEVPLPPHPLTRTAVSMRFDDPRYPMRRY
ncbi:MAG: hypothetical protein ACREXK_10905 [Gammaproteobacteria bacterium]